MPRLVVSIGASEAGTTTLFELMRQHPAAAVTAVKETNLFIGDAQYARGLSTYFPDAAGKQVLFEADNAYMCSRRCLERIKACDPSTLILLMPRNRRSAHSRSGSTTCCAGSPTAESWR